jgi:hypothetical protein
MRHFVRMIATGLALAALAACTPSDQGSIGSVSAAGGTCTPVSTDIHRSLVVHDAATLGAADFRLRRTIQAVIDSSGGAPQTPEQFLSALLVSFNQTQQTQQSGLDVPVDVRTGESGLSPVTLLNPAASSGMIPVGLFNRFDLAPSDGSNCGEHRIVYGMKQGGTVAGRFFLIFEAVLPNPNPGLGLEGCRPVAEFWASLSDNTLFPTPASRAVALEQFYYVGLPGFSAVVTHANYGVPLGQIRANVFVNFVTWQLREFRASFDLSGRASPAVDTDKQNPLAQFYDSAFDPAAHPEFAGITDPAFFDSQQIAFQDDFVTQQMALLAAPELGGGTLTAASIVNGVGSRFEPQFDEFQSVSQGLEDDPTDIADPVFRSDVSGSLGATGLSVDEVLNRAGAMTCGGCHEFSNDRVIGRDSSSVTVRWPRSARFVHIDEFGNLSDALELFFLPFRQKILENFVCETPPTDGGVVDAGPAPDAGPPMCTLRPRSGCCFDDSSCRYRSECIGEVCRRGGEGVCEPLPGPGECWEDAHCGRGETCEGESICPCGALCIVPDRPGRCVPSDCRAQDARGDGLCRLLLGWRWNGSNCETVTGCSCIGSDCKALYGTERECVVDHRHCGYTIDSAKRAVLSAPSAESRATALESFDATVDRARATEADEPGAFVPVRRTH